MTNKPYVKRRTVLELTPSRTNSTKPRATIQYSFSIGSISPGRPAGRAPATYRGPVTLCGAASVAYAPAPMHEAARELPDRPVLLACRGPGSRGAVPPAVHE